MGKQKIEVWRRAAKFLRDMSEQKKEIYDIVRIFNPMAKASRSKLTKGSTDLTHKDIDEVEKAVARYDAAIHGMTVNKIDMGRIKRSRYYIELNDYYNKNLK